MRRSILAIIILLAFSYLTATWYVGKTSQERIDDYIGQLNQEISSQWVDSDTPPEFKIVDYKRGLFSSLITYQFTYNQDSSEPDSALLLADLSHGPWPIAALKESIFTPMAAYSKIKPLHGGAMQNWFNLMDKDVSPWLMTSLFQFDGAVESDLVFNQFADPNGKFSFGGADININYQPEQSQVDIDGNLASLNGVLPESELTFNVQGLNWSALTTRGSSQNIQSHQQFDVDYLSLLWPDQTIVSARQSSFVSDSTYLNNILDAQTSYDLDEILVNDDSIGRLELVLAANKIDYAAFQQVIDAVENDDIDDDQSNKQEVYGAVSKLLEQSPSISIEKFVWSKNEDKSELHSTLNFRPIDIQDTRFIEELAEKAVDKFGLNFELSKTMVLDVLRTNFDDKSVAFISMLFDHYAARLQRLGLVVIDGHNVKSDLIYKDGLIDLNSKEMSTVEFAGLLGSIISP